MRVLIVEGCSRVRERLTERLSAVGAQVREAADSSVASVVGGFWSPDVIVLDVHLANIGVDAIGRLRQETPRALIVVLTNEVNDVHRQECVRRGADFFLDKSRDFDRFVDIILRAKKPALPR